MDAKEWGLLFVAVLCLLVFSLDINEWINGVTFVIAISCFTFFLILHYIRTQKPSIEVSVSLLLTLVGLFFTVGTDFANQFNCNPWQMLKKTFCPKSDLNFDLISCKQENTKSYYIFALDVSGSTRNIRNVPFTDEIKNKKDEIIGSGVSNYVGWSFDVDDKKEEKTIPFYRLLQVRLMHTLIKLKKEKELNKRQFSYSVVQFANAPYEIPNSSNVFDSIYYNRHRAGKTNFINLFRCLCNIIEREAVPEKNQSKSIDCYIVLYSDCVHDDERNRNKNKQEIEQKLGYFLHEIQRKSVNLKFFYLDGNNDNNKGLHIEDIIKSVFPKSPIALLGEDDELLYPKLSPIPLSFFYKNSLYEDSLSTHIIFGEKEDANNFSFRLGKYGDNDIENVNELKQEYYLNIGSKTFHLTSYPQSIPLQKREMEFKIKGYIPAPYKSPDIIIKDEKEKIEYIIPVTFYQKLPITGYLLLAIIIPILLFVLCVLVWPRKESNNLPHEAAAALGQPNDVETDRRPNGER